MLLFGNSGEILLVNPNGAIIDYVSYEVGNFPSEAQATVMPDDTNGKVSASIYRNIYFTNYIGNYTA